MNSDKLNYSSVIRCYWGAYDSKTTRVHDEQDRVLKLIKKKEPEAHCAYFPVENQFQVHVWGRSLSRMCSTRGDALCEAYNNLYKEEHDQATAQHD